MMTTIYLIYSANNSNNNSTTNTQMTYDFYSDINTLHEKISKITPEQRIILKNKIKSEGLQNTNVLDILDNSEIITEDDKVTDEILDELNNLTEEEADLMIKNQKPQLQKIIISSEKKVIKINKKQRK
jgi:hypothetical protein